MNDAMRGIRSFFPDYYIAARLLNARTLKPAETAVVKERLYNLPDVR
jgi:hypothetical protein